MRDGVAFCLALQLFDVLNVFSYLPEVRKGLSANERTLISRDHTMLTKICLRKWKRPFHCFSRLEGLQEYICFCLEAIRHKKGLR